MGALLDDAPPFVDLPPFGRLGASIRSSEMCGGDFERCRVASGKSWQASRDAANAMRDTSSACRFTTFHAYEYTWTPQLSKIHRNVIFRNDAVPEIPVSSVEARTPSSRRMCSWSTST